MKLFWGHFECKLNFDRCQDEPKQHFFKTNIMLSIDLGLLGVS